MTTRKEEPLKVLLTSMFSYGHTYACLGIGLMLHKRGHQVYFAHFPRNRELIEKQGLKFISWLDYADPDLPILDTLPTDEDYRRNLFLKSLKLTPLEILDDDARKTRSTELIRKSKGTNLAMLKIIKELNPDICFADYFWNLPWMSSVDCPVVPVRSVCPLELYNGPPMGSGYSVHDPPALWTEYRIRNKETSSASSSELEKLYSYFNVEFKSTNDAKHLGIYIYPSALDYHELGSPKENWVRLDSSIRLPETGKFELPEKLKDKPGKLIYISMGTLASEVTELLNMILTPLAKSPHRFIVSTGKYGDTVKLYDNMWGEKFVNQIAILPKVDLFITHGGSNSLIEGLTAGKPLIVIPLFADQLDNAQRVVDLELGAKINFYEFSGEKLLKVVEDVLCNEKMHLNVARISEELKKSDSSSKVISLIEQLAYSQKT